MEIIVVHPEVRSDIPDLSYTFGVGLINDKWEYVISPNESVPGNKDRKSRSEMKSVKRTVNMLLECGFLPAPALIGKIATEKDPRHLAAFAAHVLARGASFSECAVVGAVITGAGEVSEFCANAEDQNEARAVAAASFSEELTFTDDTGDEDERPANTD